jgi:hypothetical protein
MRQTTRYAYLAFEANGLLDRGEQATFDEVHERIDDGTVLDWLDSFDDVDLSLYQADDRVDVLRTFRAYANAADSGKLLVQHNGIALIAAYCIERLQHPDAELGG